MANSLLCFAILTALSVAYSCGFTRLERLRLAVSHRHVSSMLGMFTFAGVVLLPNQLIVALTASVYGAAWPTFKRAGAPFHRHAYNAGAVTIGCVAAASVMDSLHHLGPLAFIAGIATFMSVNLALVIAVIIGARQFRSLQMLKRPQIHGYVFAGQAAGAIVGICMEWSPALGVAGIPVLAAIHSDALQDSLRTSRAYLDGIYSQRAWLVLADEAARRGELFSVVMIETAAGQDHDAALAAARRHARLAGEEGQHGLPPRHADAVGNYSTTQVVVLRHLSPAVTARRAARAIVAALADIGVVAAPGAADMRAGGLASALAVACAETAVSRSAIAAAELN